MDRTRRKLIVAVAAGLTPVSFPSLAQEMAYTTLQNALPVENPGKVEVAEFFWYGCIHCYHLEPVLEAWLPKLPPDAYFRRIPAAFNERWALDATIFYAFESLGLLGKLHRPFFDAIHKDRLRSDNPAALGEWLTKQGVDSKKFEATMKSFGVQSKTKRAAQLTAASRIDGTPSMMVQGLYTISTEQGRSQEGMLTTAERLIPQVRKSLAGTK
jgi:protein dithiol oxidoreductase (disulfide-forming)